MGPLCDLPTRTRVARGTTQRDWGKLGAINGLCVPTILEEAGEKSKHRFYQGNFQVRENKYNIAN